MAKKGTSIILPDGSTTGQRRSDRVPNSGVSNSRRKIPIYKHESDLANPYYAFPSGESENKPKGELSITRDAAWTQSPTANRNDIVELVITEYQPRYSSTIASLLKNTRQLEQWADEAVNIAESDDGVVGGIKRALEFTQGNPIANSFQARKTGFKYRLPYLQLTDQSFATMFTDGEEGKKNVLSKMVDFTRERAANVAGGFGVGAKALLGLASFGPAMADMASSVLPAINPSDSRDAFYKGSSPVSYPLTFELLNTIDHEKAKFHKELVELFSHNMGMGDLRTPFVGDSPCIYTIEIDGIRWCPACKIDFSYLGNGNLIYIDGVPYPESYTVTMNVTEFFPPIRSLYNHYVKYGEKFMAITTEDICKQLEGALDATQSVISKLSKLVTRT